MKCNTAQAVQTIEYKLFSEIPIKCKYLYARAMNNKISINRNLIIENNIFRSTGYQRCDLYKIQISEIHLYNIVNTHLVS